MISPTPESKAVEALPELTAHDVMQMYRVTLQEVAFRYGYEGERTKFFNAAAVPEEIALEFGMKVQRLALGAAAHALATAQAEQAKPANGLGTPGGRFFGLMDQLEQRFPDPEPYSARPPEGRLIAQIDALIASLPSPPSDRGPAATPLPVEQAALEWVAIRAMTDSPEWAGEDLVAAYCAGAREQAGQPITSPHADMADAERQANRALHAFVLECSKLEGGMVNGNILSAKANALLAARPEGTGDADAAAAIPDGLAASGGFTDKDKPIDDAMAFAACSALQENKHE